MSSFRGRHGVVGLGVVLLAVAVAHHGREPAVVGGSAGPLLAFAIDGGLAVTLAYAGRWLADADLSTAEEWRVFRWSVAGGAFAVVAAGGVLGVWVVEGRPIVEPEFLALVAAGSGSIGGTLAGYLAVRQAAAARRAEDATRALAFVNRLVRHDLRNDLTAIRGYADLADGEGDLDRDAARLVSRKAEEGLDRLETARSVAEALAGEADHEPIDLVPVVREAVASVDDHERATVETDLLPAAWVVADEGLASVVDNLVENAIQHGGSEPTVAVELSAGDEAVVLTVADDGPGIDPERRDALFEGDDVAGLAIVRTLVSDYGGTVDVGESESGGARFVVTLPRASDDAVPADARVSGAGDGEDPRSDGDEVSAASAGSDS